MKENLLDPLYTLTHLIILVSVRQFQDRLSIGFFNKLMFGGPEMDSY